MKTTSVSNRLNSVILAATGLANRVAEIAEDRKISWTEAFSLAGQAGNAETLITEGKGAVADYLRLNADEREEVLDLLAEKLVVAREEVDAKIDRTIHLLGSLETHVRGTIDDVQELKSLWS